MKKLLWAVVVAVVAVGCGEPSTRDDDLPPIKVVGNEVHVTVVPECPDEDMQEIANDFAFAYPGKVAIVTRNDGKGTKATQTYGPAQIKAMEAEIRKKNLARARGQ
jgi:hypothetical protein